MQKVTTHVYGAGEPMASVICYPTKSPDFGRDVWQKLALHHVNYNVAGVQML